MPVGYVKAFGKKALTIETNDLNQYYAPFTNISDSQLLHLIQHPIPYIPVQFDVNTLSHSGSTSFGPRFYATNIHFHLVI